MWRVLERGKTMKLVRSWAATCAARMKYVLAFGLTFLAPLPVIADTTYSYTGAPYTSTNTPVGVSFGTNMTGTVMFNFDTTGFTGIITNDLLNPLHITN